MEGEKSAVMKGTVIWSWLIMSEEYKTAPQDKPAVCQYTRLELLLCFGFEIIRLPKIPHN